MDLERLQNLIDSVYYPCTEVVQKATTEYRQFVVQYPQQILRLLIVNLLETDSYRQKIASLTLLFQLFVPQNVSLLSNVDEETHLFCLESLSSFFKPGLCPPSHQPQLANLVARIADYYLKSPLSENVIGFVEKLALIAQEDFQEMGALAVSCYAQIIRLNRNEANTTLFPLFQTAFSGSVSFDYLVASIKLLFAVINPSDIYEPYLQFAPLVAITYPSLPSNLLASALHDLFYMLRFCPNFFSDCCMSLAQSLMKVFVNTNNREDNRLNSITAVVNMCSTPELDLSQIIPTILESLVEVMQNSDDIQETDGYDDSLFGYASLAIKKLSKNRKIAPVFAPAIIECCSDLFATNVSKNAQIGLVLLTNTLDACKILLTPSLNNIIKTFINGVTSNVLSVRIAALNGIAQVVTSFDTLAYHKAILKAILHSCEGNEQERSVAIFSLSVFIEKTENLEEIALQQVLSMLLNKFFDSRPTEQNSIFRCLSVIATKNSPVLTSVIVDLVKFISSIIFHQRGAPLTNARAFETFVSIIKGNYGPEFVGTAVELVNEILSWNWGEFTPEELKILCESLVALAECMPSLLDNRSEDLIKAFFTTCYPSVVFRYIDRLSDMLCLDSDFSQQAFNQLIHIARTQSRLRISALRTILNICIQMVSKFNPAVNSILLETIQTIFAIVESPNNWSEIFDILSTLFAHCGSCNLSSDPEFTECVLEQIPKLITASYWGSPETEAAIQIALAEAINAYICRCPEEVLYRYREVINLLVPLTEDTTLIGVHLWTDYQRQDIQENSGIVEYVMKGIKSTNFHLVRESSYCLGMLYDSEHVDEEQFMNLLPAIVLRINELRRDGAVATYAVGGLVYAFTVITRSNMEVFIRRGFANLWISWLPVDNPQKYNRFIHYQIVDILGSEMIGFFNVETIQRLIIIVGDILQNQEPESDVRAVIKSYLERELCDPDRSSTIREIIGELPDEQQCIIWNLLK